MQKETLRPLCELGLSQREIGERLGIKQSKVGYWLRKLNLNNQSNFYICNKTKRYCPCCLTTKPIGDFYGRFPDGSGSSPYCKSCTKSRVSKTQKDFKKQCVQYKGGKCQICGYSKYLSALEFHHRNSQEKDFTISQRTLIDFSIHKKELDKCDLLCCRCHREIHEQIFSGNVG